MLFESDASGADFTGTVLKNAKMQRARLIPSVVRGRRKWKVSDLMISRGSTKPNYARQFRTIPDNLVEATAARANLEGANPTIPS